MLNQLNVSLWGDEAFSAVLSSKPIPDIIKIIIHDTSPPLYNITEHIWFGIFGNSEIAIRSLSFLYFLIAIFFVYKIAISLWNRNTAVVATVLTFLNPFFFTYAFEGRMYSLLAATVTASFYFFLSENWVLYVTSTSLALYTHHFAIFAVFVQGLLFLKEFFFGRRKQAISILKSLIVVAILYLPWVIPLYGQTKMVGSGFWLGKPTLTELLGIGAKYLATGINSPLATLTLIIAIIILTIRIWNLNTKKTFSLLSWFAIPILVTWLISQKFSSIFFDRYLLFTIPGAMLILSSNLRRLSYILLIPLIALFVITDVFYFTHPTKIPFKDLASYVQKMQKPGDFLINEDVGNHKLWESKYYKIPAPIYNPSNTSLPYFVGTALMEKDDVISKLPKDSVRLGVITYKKGSDLKFKGFKVLNEKSFGNLNFVWMTRRSY